MTEITALLTVILILAGAFYMTRFVGKAYLKQASGRHLRVVEQIRVAPDKSVVLLQSGNEYYLVGVSPSGVTLISRLDGCPEEIEEKTGQNGQTPDMPGSVFVDILREKIKTGRRKKNDE